MAMAIWTSLMLQFHHVCSETTAGKFTDVTAGAGLSISG
jgi:hypothetical protein